MRKSNDRLLPYKRKRDFSVTPEPHGPGAGAGSTLIFVIQKHDARSRHYDFRLELDGVLKSWAVPKGPSLDPALKRLAVRTEDHPLDYTQFEGIIPSGQYGAGSMIIWDRGVWEPLGDPFAGLKAGHLKFRLSGEKLRGAWALVRMQGNTGEKQENWLLIKEKDHFAETNAGVDVADRLPGSVLAKSEAPLIPAGAKTSPVPSALAPQLATLADRIPVDNNWSWEIKFDGYRILARFDGGRVDLFTRNGNAWTDKLPGLAAALKGLKIEPGWLDGEIVLLGKDGAPDFAALQNAFDSSRVEEIRYFVFDLPFYNGFDLRQSALYERRELLRKVLALSNSPQIQFSEEFEGEGREIFESACKMGLEGIIGKRRDSPYVSSRSANWIKLKCGHRQEFVVVGYTESKDPGRAIGSLILGFYDEQGRLRYAGKTGTGFDHKTMQMLKDKLSRLATEQSALHDKPKDVKGNWVSPQLVAEISFAAWTSAGRLRQPVFRGLRQDLGAKTITREAAGPLPRSGTKGAKAPLENKPNTAGSSTVEYKITNPERIIDPGTGLRKQDLVDYYQLVSSYMLPHLKNRPVSFLRAPSGVNGQLFFQKHADTMYIPELKRLDPELDSGHQAMMEVNSVKALIGAVQMNVIEFHTWNATAKKIDQPDRMILDLDPGEGVGWPAMQEAAELTRTLLEELGLRSFLKTSGGKGLHIVVPLSERHDWDTVRDFARAVSQHLAMVMPDRFASLSGPRNRIGKIFVDYIRNSRGATTAVAFSARARPGLGVSVPCSWAELFMLTGGAHWNISNLSPRLRSGMDPWKEYHTQKQILTSKAQKMLKM